MEINVFSDAAKPAVTTSILAAASLKESVLYYGRNQMYPFNPRLAALAKEKHVHGFFGFTCLHLVAAHFPYEKC
jgi:hypothetical protein